MSSPPAKFDFLRAAREEVIREGFQPDFPPAVLNEVRSFTAAPADHAGRDLRGLLWSSIDNTDSRDLDQVEWAEKRADGKMRILVGIADVDAVVDGHSATDAQARANATSIYPGGPVFPMLPERLSTDLTSLGQDVDRRALVMEVYRGPGRGGGKRRRGNGRPRNHARLNYDEVAAWLQLPAPPERRRTCATSCWCNRRPANG